MRGFARANDDSQERERERRGWTWAQVREHRKGVAVRVPLNEERKRYGNRGLGPRGGTSRSSQTAKHVPASSRTSIAREAAHISLSLSLSPPVPLCLSVSSSSIFFPFFFSSLPNIILVASFTRNVRAWTWCRVVKKKKGKVTNTPSARQIHPGHRKSSSLVRCSWNARSNHADRRRIEATKGERTIRISSSSFVDEI